MLNPDLQIVSTKTVTQSFNRSLLTLKRWSEQGHFPKSVKVNGRVIGWWRRDIELWLKNSTEPKNEEVSEHE
ncbi:TPA: AlpA family phage regulatory protein [Vibrio parahaemolyticus]|uniref:helix-turn-helix transcriptional regulator n=1 Tax=Vibrio TaxID=662 RepID=UPI00186AB66F|nr:MULTISPECIES: AlpA family phage regulatory protein [Vibrio]EHR0554784.1 AlpA family phage regulatory protein [Vibrio parahaemolyticus]EKA7393674.1 AlpA family phage regulatory protein [Vibrio parahaemolyticus]MBE4214184.1 AlpA family phage regulatory protein [Vibrio parahaemolyticus]MCG3730794.1 AlpA family phage regulatory protein [Vibrio cincinnatiensis]MCR9980211.1 AlpA family phage regulatory protein [Vibrio parahaemolyticus]